MQWIYLSYPKKCITDKIHKKIFVTKWIRTQTHLETSIPTEQPYGFNEGDQLFTSDNGTQFGLSSESHLANTLLHPTSKAIWNLYWGMCHPGNRNSEGSWGAAESIPIVSSFIVQETFNPEKSRAHPPFILLSSLISFRKLKKPKRGSINHPLQDIPCSRNCAKY